MIIYSPAMWAWTQQLQADAVAVDERCVNEGAKRSDGSFCREKAEPNGWCEACGAELFPPGWERVPN